MKILLIQSILLLTNLLSMPVFAEGTKCVLNDQVSDYKPHTQVESDINGDGVKDLFYLVGEEDVFQTCVFLGKKIKDKITYNLVHSHANFYDTVFDFDQSKKAQILVPSDISQDCEENEGGSLEELIPKNLKIEIEKSYKSWSREFVAYNYTYGRSEYFPIQNLFLFNDVNIFKFEQQVKTNVTTKMTSYFDLKRKVLAAVIKQKNISKKCKSKLELTLKKSTF